MSRGLGELKGWLPRRPEDSHKGDFGHVLVVAGSKGMAGAALLTARAACRAGAGLVTLAVPEQLQNAVAGHLPEALTLGLPQTAAGTLAPEAVGRLYKDAGAKRWSVLAVGPGLSTHPETERALISLLDRVRIPAVVDADALNLLSRHNRSAVRELFARRGAPCVLTPHPGEMGRLLGRTAEQVQERRADCARELARELGCVCLLKGRGTVLTDGSRTRVNPTGNAGLAKGGTGDALTGVIAALWAQMLGTGGPAGGFEAAALGAWLHGAAADAAVRRTGERSLLASDVIEALPEAFRRLG